MGIVKREEIPRDFSERIFLMQALKGYFETQDRPIPNDYYSYILEGRNTCFKIVQYTAVYGYNMEQCFIIRKGFKPIIIISSRRRI